MKTIEAEIAVMKFCGIRRNIIVPNVSFGVSMVTKHGWEVLHECDILSLTKSGYATEIEIKVSKADLLKDKEKRHNHKSNIIKYLYFAVPEKLKDIALSEIPERAGLLIIKRNRYWDKPITFCERIKSPVVNKDAVKWKDEDILNLARLGCMRLFTLKKKLLSKQLDLL